MQLESLEERIQLIRQFNRSFTRRIGALSEGLLHSPYSLTEARILFELAHQEQVTASGLVRSLGLDAGYLSRLLAQLEQQGLIDRVRAEHDARQRWLRLTPMGTQAFALLDQRARDEVAELLNDLGEAEQQRLLNAIQAIEQVLDAKPALKFAEPFYLRPPEPGDMGWVTHRHAALYQQEYGWDTRFEAFVAQIVADFINNFKPERERCWIAEMNGEIVGSVFVVQLSDSVAKLRLLLVEPKARGVGLGSRLVAESIRFARRSGYQKLVLWTNSILVEARHIYHKAGFRLVEQWPEPNFGQELISENWELDLADV